MIRKSFCFYIGFLSAFIALLMRLFSLSIGDNNLAAQSVLQGREKRIVLYRTRGLIYDERFIPIAGDQKCTYLLVNPRDFDRSNADKLASITNMNTDRINNKLKLETPFVLKCESYREYMDGVYSFEGVGRYSKIAKHVLGYMDGANELGVSGLEREYNGFLNLFSSEVSVSYNSDALMGAIAGLGIEMFKNESTENGVVTTLDSRLNRKLEELMDQYIDIGTAIILESETGAIKAISSRPSFDAENIEDYLKSEGGELINRAFTPQAVGSVFKIVLAACALENGAESFEYCCTGGISINGRTFLCHNHEGHGVIDLKEAFAQSCNAYFIALGQMIGRDQIIEMAKRFKFDEELKITDTMLAAKGNLLDEEGSLSLANLSIGQGALLASPMHIALMTAVISNGGRMPEPHLIKGLYLNNKMKYEKHDDEEEEFIISSDVADRIKEFCIHTVEEGTGKSAKPLIGSAGGKTASAQTGEIINGSEKLNVYFTGFYPAEEPRYVITIYAENGESGGVTCAPVFREICDFLSAY